jgi:Xaa-Pro aminopeptidase
MFYVCCFPEELVSEVREDGMDSCSVVHQVADQVVAQAGEEDYYSHHQGMDMDVYEDAFQESGGGYDSRGAHDVDQDPHSTGGEREAPEDNEEEASGT